MSSELGVLVLLRGSGGRTDLDRTLQALRENTVDLEIRPSDSVVGARSGSVVVVVPSSASGAPDQSDWDAVDDADVVLLEIGATVGPLWLERLRAAAYADPIIATASAVPAALLRMHGTVATDVPAEGAAELDRPALAEPLWGCVYVRRDAVRMATNARRAAKSGSTLEELVVLPGLVHVLAPAVRVSTAHGRRQGASETPAVARTLTAIAGATEPLRVTVDVRCAAFPLSGTQVHALNLVAALAERDDLELSVVAPEGVHESVRPHLEAIPSRVRRYTPGESAVPRPQVFHRPYQVLFDDELGSVLTSGTRLVLTHQDLILDRAPGYFRSEDEWRAYSATTALSFLAADEVVFFSEHARREALRDGLVDPAKTSVIPPGTNHLNSAGDGAMPTALGPLLGAGGRPFFLVMGNAYAHKNRVFALKVAEALAHRHGWPGALVFAGERPGSGSSLDEERGFLDDHGDLAQRFLDLGPVSEAERRWLYSEATLLLCPSLHEGFGLVPFEAAAAGTASAYSARTSFADYLPREGALLDLGSVEETAERINAFVQDGKRLEEIASAIRAAGAALTWSRAANAYCDVYRRAIERPVGFSMLSRHGLVAGALSQRPSSETERRLVAVFRRSVAVRLVVRALFAAALYARRVARRRR